MKRYTLVLIAITFILAACAGQRDRILFIPTPEQDEQEQTDPFDLWQILESQSGPADAEIPQWVRFYYNDRSRGIESLEQYSSDYIFAGENRGSSFNALNQWANGFTPRHDLPRLIAARVERRLLSSASLYPDDEYGQFFETLIRTVSDSEFPGAVKGETFWILRSVVIQDEENVIDDDSSREEIMERYEFLVTISINRHVLQEQLREIMSGIRTTVPPTREQAVRINRIQQIFFEGF